MLNKRALLASSALAVLASVSQAQAGDFYVSLFGGGNFQNDRSGSGAIATDTVDTKTGFLLGGAIGTHLDKWLHGLRAELEADYRHNHADGHWSQSTLFFGPTGGPIDGTVSTFAILANLWYDIDIGQKWVPYIGGGAGYGRTKFDGVLQETFGTLSGQGTSFSVERSGFVYQLGAGINYEIQQGVSLGIGYRFFRGPNIKNNVFVGKNSNSLLPVNGENENHSVLISLTIDTN